MTQDMSTNVIQFEVESYKDTNKMKVKLMSIDSVPKTDLNDTRTHNGC